jgi:signal peptidase I
LPGYAEPQRRDVAVFVSPPQVEAIRITPDQVTPTLVKRIVGIAGDTVFMRSGVLYVNGVAESGVDSIPAATDPKNVEDPLFSWQSELAIKGSRFGEPVVRPTLHNWGPLVVPAGHFFMMGDNRDNSVDSRYYGTVPRENMRGRPTFVYYSFDMVQGVDYFRAITEIRWSRLGTWIK